MPTNNILSHDSKIIKVINFLMQYNRLEFANVNETPYKFQTQSKEHIKKENGKPDYSIQTNQTRYYSLRQILQKHIIN